VEAWKKGWSMKMIFVRLAGRRLVRYQQNLCFFWQKILKITTKARKYENTKVFWKSFLRALRLAA
jgi:hypothetical protein